MLTWVEISARALTRNIRIFKTLVGASEIVPVIKSNAYGHGMEVIARLGEGNAHIRGFAVASLDEALALYMQGIRKPLYVLSFFDAEQIKEVPRGAFERISLPLYDMPTARFLYRILKKRKIKARLHLKIDTGTTRIGILPYQYKEVIEFLVSSSDYITLEGIYTHFADAEEHNEYTAAQNARFMEARRLFAAAGFQNVLTHSACTAAAVRRAATQYDMVRIGIGLYGLPPTTKIGKQIFRKTGSSLESVLTWKTKLIQCKEVPRGTPIGYGRTYTTKRPAVIGIVPVGYYDGYDRGFSNKGSMVIRNIVCPVVGRVSMNLTMVDVTRAHAHKGDEVVLIGARPPVDATTQARLLGTINYEVVTRINAGIPRFSV